MPSFFAGVTGKNTATLFEIRLESDVLVLRGGENEAASQLLRGVVVLCLRDAEKVQDVHLKMTGQSRVGWNDQKLTAAGVSSNRVSHTTEIFSHKWPAFVGGDGPGATTHGVTLGKTNYEWPFELVIPGDMSESVEGLYDSWVRYRLKATIARGKWAYDLHCTKPVRIIRTFDPAALELAHAMTVENVWPNKIEYSLVVPQKAIIFGTSINIEMRFTSLLKGLRIGRIKCSLIENQEFSIMAPGQPERYHKNSRDIGQWAFEVSEDHYQDMINEDGQDGYLLNETLPLPRSLKLCIQDCETNGIKIRHKIKFSIALHNPDGHTSELRATLPVTIFISPNIPFDEAGNLLDQGPLAQRAPGLGTHAPPLYGEHILDQLYADVDPSGYLTPNPHSGMNTPFYQSRSGAGSSENIAAAGRLDDIANTEFRPDALSSRLQSLNGTHSGAISRNNSVLRGQRRSSRSGVATPAFEDGALHHALASTTAVAALGSAIPSPNLPRVQSGYFGNSPTMDHLSRRTSEEDHPHATSGHHTPEHDDFAELSKVPSYTTALRAPVRPISYAPPGVEALPDYDAATSAPPSPNRSFATLTPLAIPAPPAQAHVHDSERPRADSGGNADGSRLTRGMANLSTSPRERTPMYPGNLSPVMGPHGAHDDASRRLHLMQARGRAH